VTQRTGGPDAAQISGIGDGAVFTTDSKAHDGKAMAFVVKQKACSWKWDSMETEATRWQRRTISLSFSSWLPRDFSPSRLDSNGKSRAPHEILKAPITTKAVNGTWVSKGAVHVRVTRVDGLR
jgi:hypothetical protein